MSSKNSYVVNFHGIGIPARALEADEVLYWISAEKFTQSLALIKKLQHSQNLIVTFDDGNISDYEIALPALSKAFIRGIFFVLANKIDRKGYLTTEQIRAISASGHEIGLHGMDHVDWTQLDDKTLVRETEEARLVLEEITGKPINAVAVPFGRYNRVVLNKLKTLGFKRIYTSDQGKRFMETEVKPRFTVTHDTELQYLEEQIVKSNFILNRIICEFKYQLKSRR